MSVPFRNVAEWYDLLYREKRYGDEAAFVHTLVSAHRRTAAPDSRTLTLLDLGCGTAQHAQHLAQFGYLITGVDNSPEMLKVARTREHKTLRVTKGDIRDVRLGQTFDVIVSLFHVFGYLPTNGDFESGLRSASAHSHPGTLLIFDGWYGPSVLAQPPTCRTRKVGLGARTLTRSAYPTHLPERQQVEVRYELTVEDREKLTQTEYMELHLMRYLFPDEVSTTLSKVGFEPLFCGAWMEHAPPCPQRWDAYWVAVKT